MGLRVVESRRAVLIFLLGYLPFFLVAFRVYDMNNLKHKIGVVSAIYVFNIVCLALFAGVLNWI